MDQQGVVADPPRPRQSVGLRVGLELGLKLGAAETAPLGGPIRPIVVGQMAQTK
jgi:hypothetical protein